MRSLRISVVSVFVLLIAAMPSLAVDWETAIKKVEEASSEYFDYVRDKGGSTWVGTAYNGYEYDRHQCAIIGRMLGLQEVIVELETMPHPPMDGSVEDQDLLVFATSLDSWVLAARRAVDMDDAGRRNVWNLDCVGHLGISNQHYIGNANPEAQFKFEGTTLYVYGDIDTGFFDRFKVMLEEHSTTTEIALGSGGGSVVDALLAGYEIRSRGLSTTIFGRCYSACPLVFMGGTERRLWSSPNRLGFHQISRSGEPVPLDEEIYSLTAQYLQAMNVDAKAVITWMTSASPDEMYEPPMDDLCTPRVATWVQRVCGF
jgi:hypothetical protein